MASVSNFLEPELDWDVFRRTTRTLSLDDLAIYSQASIDPLTVEVALFLSQQFTIASHVPHDLSEIFDNLAHLDFGTGITLGYDERHIVHVISATEPGGMFLGIIGTLAEYFTEDVLVDAFSYLAKNAHLPNTIAPSQTQWRRLFHVCYGVLSAADFGLRADELSVPRSESSRDSDSSRAPLERTSSRMITESLQLMSHLARNRNDEKERGICLLAGKDAGWFAAVAEWLFDLDVVLSARYDDRIEGEWPPLLLVLRQDPGIPCDGDMSARPVPLQDEAITGGRVPWQTLFTSVYGKAFHDIHEVALARVIGCAARQTDTTLFEQGSAGKGLPPQTSQTVSTGARLVENLCTHLPELARLRPLMERCLSLTLEEARQDYGACLQELAQACKCQSCTSTSARSVQHCKVYLTKFITSLAFVVANMNVYPELSLKRSGVLALYRRLQEHCISEMDVHQHLMRSSKPEVSAYPAPVLSMPASVLETALILFTGSAPSGLKSACTGVTHRGVSVWLKSSRKRGAMESVQDIAVFPGTFSYHGRIFERAFWDGKDAGAEYQDTMNMIRSRAGGLEISCVENGDDLRLSLARRENGEEQRVEEDWTML